MEHSIEHSPGQGGDIVINGKAEEFAAFLAEHKGERHAVVLQDFPGQDAISCGFAYQVLAETHDIETTLIFGGRISRQENIALISLLDIELLAWGPEPIPPDRFQGAVFVDNQGATSTLTERIEEMGIPILAVIDHHADQQRLKPAFMDLRTVGACAAIFASYFDRGGVMRLKGSSTAHRKLATALMYGIISDTNSMILATEFDFMAGAMLERFYDHDILVEILHQKRNHKVMGAIQDALAQRNTYDGFCLAGIGYLREDDRDAIPQVADFLLSEQNVHTAIVYGVVTFKNGSESVQGSLRSTRHAMAPDAFLKESLGQDKYGAFYGGGKAMAGGFEIPLGFLSGSDGPDLSRVKWEAFNVKIRKKFLDKIGMALM